jgi:hypothetical protein
MSNASRYFVKDFVFIHATQFIPKNTEILISYVNAMEPYSTRQKNLSHHGFICKCDLCSLDQSELKYEFEQRQKLGDFYVANITPKIQQNDKSVMALAEKTIESMEQTYHRSGRRNFMTDLLQPLIALGSLYERSGMFKEGASAYEMPFEICGLDVDALERGNWSKNGHGMLAQHLVQCGLHVSLDYLDSGYKSKAKKWYIISKNVAKCIYGMDSNTFHEAYHDFTKDLKLFYDDAN